MISRALLDRERLTRSAAALARRHKLQLASHIRASHRFQLFPADSVSLVGSMAKTKCFNTHHVGPLPKRFEANGAGA